MKEVKDHNGEHWQVCCPECDAWHYVRVLVQAELYILPGGSVRCKWLNDPEIVCSCCEQDVEFLLKPDEKQSIIDLAHST